MVEDNWVRNHLVKRDIQKPMGPDGIHPSVLSELVGIIARPLSIIFERSRQSGEVPEDLKTASVTPIFKNGRKEDPGNYSPVSLTSIPACGRQEAD